MRDWAFYSVCFGFIFGVLLRSFVFVNIYLTILFSVISVALFLFFAFVSKKNLGILISIFVLMFSVGMFRFDIADTPNPVVFESKVSKNVSLTGKIVDEPNVKENNQQLTLLAKLVQTDTNSAMAESVSVKILLSTGLEENYKYGDEISLKGTLKKPENFITDQGKVFDYVNYLRKDGILYVMSYSKIEIVSRGNGNIVKSALFFAKGKFLEKMDFAIPEPENLLMGGLILGERSSFGQEMRQRFIDTGTIHIVALSGYNVTIVAEWIMEIFAFLPRNFGFSAGIFGILLFVVMAGGQATAVRAGTMAVLALIARATGRNYDVARALILAGVFMILLNPFVLVYDVSFQLSFIATVAVIFFTPKIEKYFLWVTKSFGLRDIISVTCATYIFIMPFILYKMGNLSIVALPANILILPLIPFTMFLGFLTSFVGLISYVPSVPLGYISYLFLHYELGVINFFANIPFASLSFPNFPFLLTLAIYAYFIYVLFGKS